MSPFQLYRRALGFLAPEKWQAIGLASAGLAIAMVQLAEPILFGWVVDALSKGGEAFPIIALWAALGLFGIVASVVLAVFSDRMAHRRRLAAISGAFQWAITLPAGYHAERGSGAIVRTILAGSSALFWLWLGALREQLTAIVGILLLIPAALVLDWRMAIILAALATTYTVLNVFVMRKTSSGQAEVERHDYDVSGRVGDVIGNVTVVQSYARLAAEASAMRTLTGQLLEAQYPVLTWWGLLAVLQKAAATLTMVAVFAVGAVLAHRGELSVGTIVSFVAFANLLISKLDQLSSFAVRIHQQTPLLNSYFALLDEPLAVTEKPDAYPLTNVQGHVRFDDVTFRYGKEDERPGVFNITFEAETGQTIALVGPTGCGKSTTLALMQRFRPLQKGQITIDGHDVTDVTLSSLRESISVVFQDAGLFNRSIGDNIRIGKPTATDAEVERAARIAEAHDFIANKPGGYDFVIGERGAALSGGERQRIAIARAILKDAPILILDEATSALDAETEARIKRALDALRKGRTTFIIAHRLSTVANADRILVLDKGRIIERGRFEELANSGGLFARLVSEGGFTVPRPVEEQSPGTT